MYMAYRMYASIHLRLIMEDMYMYIIAIAVM
jgi:hypothetical protein